MTNRSKFEDLIEYVVNGEQKKAEELFHEIVVEHAREIYQGLFENEISEFDLEEAMSEEDDEEEMEESYEDLDLDEVGGDPADDMMDKVGTDDTEMDMDSDEDEKMDTDSDDEMTGDDGEIQDLKSQLEDLIEKFKEITGEEVGDEDSEMGMDDEEDSEMDMDDEEDETMKDSYMPAFEEELDELDLSPVEQMREYVEKIADAYKGGKAAATHETGSPYTKSTVAGPNDMGGTAKNLVQGGEGSTHGTKGGLLNPAPTDIKSGNVNVPGSNTATKMHAQPKGHGAEKKGTGEQAQNTTSLIGSKR
jgi:hypothetical protein